jgi:hypothetical protein
MQGYKCKLVSLHRRITVEIETLIRRARIALLYEPVEAVVSRFVQEGVCVEVAINATRAAEVLNRD